MTVNSKGWIERSGPYFEKVFIKKGYALLQQNNGISIEIPTFTHIRELRLHPKWFYNVLCGMVLKPIPQIGSK